MTKEKLKEANDLAKRISSFKHALHLLQNPISTSERECTAAERSTRAVQNIIHLFALSDYESLTDLIQEIEKSIESRLQQDIANAEQALSDL